MCIRDSGKAQWPLLRGGNVAVVPVLRCNDYGLLLDAALHGLGIALVPEIMARSHPRQSELELILDGIVGARRDVHLTYARTARRRRIVQAFVDFVFKYVKDQLIVAQE